MSNGLVTAATRSAFLELQDEQILIQEGYDLLDQERILIAAEILQQLSSYQSRFEAYTAEHEKALKALAGASSRLGFDGLTIHPPVAVKSVELARVSRLFLGVVLDDDLDFTIETEPHQTGVVYPEAVQCARCFTELTKQSAILGAQAANLRRLCAKYIQTERRAKALENVLLPEIQQALKFIDEKLEAVEQEDVIRVRSCRREDF